MKKKKSTQNQNKQKEKEKTINIQRNNYPNYWKMVSSKISAIEYFEPRQLVLWTAGTENVIHKLRGYLFLDQPNWRRKTNEKRKERNQNKINPKKEEKKN